MNLRSYLLVSIDAQTKNIRFFYYSFQQFPLVFRIPRFANAVQPQFDSDEGTSLSKGGPGPQNGWPSVVPNVGLAFQKLYELCHRFSIINSIFMKDYFLQKTKTCNLRIQNPTELVNIHYCKN